MVSDAWYDFVLHVKWSSDPSVGFVEVWVNDEKVVPKTAAATLFPGTGAYMKQGYYRSDSELTSAIFHAATTRGSSFAAVDPSGSGQAR